MGSTLYIAMNKNGLWHCSPHEGLAHFSQVTAAYASTWPNSLSTDITTLASLPTCRALAKVPIHAITFASRMCVSEARNSLTYNINNAATQATGRGLQHSNNRVRSTHRTLMLCHYPKALISGAHHLMSSLLESGTAVDLDYNVCLRG